MRENFSPEEKLLKLIKGEKKVARQELRKTETKVELKPVTSPNFLRPYLSFAHLYKFSLVAAAITFIYFMSMLAYPLFAPKRIKLAKALPEKKEKLEALQKQETKPLEFYLQGTEGKKIFSGASLAASTPESAICGDSDVIKSMNLVGIISGDNPQAVIEDTKSQKTYYVTRGQYIGEFQIENIEEGRIVLNFRGKRYELSL